MPVQDQQTLKLLLKKFARSDLFLLSEAAQRLGVGEDYLRDLIKSGKVKAFKADQYWFIEEDWVEEFRNKLKSRLQEEIKQSTRPVKNNIWTKPIAGKKLKLIKLSATGWDRAVWATYGLAVMALAFAFLVAPIRVNPQKAAVGNGFLFLTHQVYGYPSSKLASIDGLPAKRFVAKINDEDLTKFLKRLFRPPQLNYPGQVAGESEAKIVWPNRRNN